MKLSLDLIAAALDKNMFDTKPGKYQGLIILVNEDRDKGETAASRILLGDEDTIGVSIVHMMQEDPAFAAMILACAEMYNSQQSLPDLGGIIGGLDKALSALEEVCGKFDKNHPKKPNHKRKN